MDPPCRARSVLVALHHVGLAPSRSAFDTAVHRLRTQGLLDRNRAGGLRPTRAGRASVTLSAPGTEAPPAPEGFLYFVTYDIPVRFGSIRNRYCQALHRQGWRRLHKSLWVADRDIRAEAQESAEAFDLGGYVFCGSGALVTPLRRQRGERSDAEMCDGLKAVTAAPESRLGQGYRRWAELTDRLQAPAAAAWLSEEVRRAWEAAVEVLRRRLKAVDARRSEAASPSA
jgi:hypothetical protein